MKWGINEQNAVTASQVSVIVDLQVNSILVFIGVITSQTVTTSPTLPECPPHNSGAIFGLSAEGQSDPFHIKISFLFAIIDSDLLLTRSSCDSRNLNLSPFCNTSLTSLAMWQPSVLKTYGGQEKLDYLDKITGPMRKKYPNSMGDRELITSLTEVRVQYFNQ